MLVIDATHGGLTLSQEYAAAGNEVTCADVHRTVSKTAEAGLRGAYRLVKAIPNLGQFDLVVRPVHFPKQGVEGAGAEVITHHQAVQRLLEGRLGYPVVEMTGSFGKTSAIWAALSMLKGECSALALTSDGIFFLDGGGLVPLSGKVSTTPANIIRAVRLAPKRPDLAIFEVSLGGTGLADLGIIKNVYDNYSIARGSSCAFEAKMSMIDNAKPDTSTLINGDDPLLAHIKGAQHFSVSSKASEVTAREANIKGKIRFRAAFDGFKALKGRTTCNFEVNANPRLVGGQHVENMLVGIAIAVFFGAGEDEAKALEKAEPFGRKMVIEEGGAFKRVVNASSSIVPRSLEVTIKEFSESFPTPAPISIGGKLKTTCGGVDIKGIS
ncbi:MAG TPA: Mur ligase family protein, partial [Candidatus Methanomethylicus sp.]|nr:Mur ligase family protein [Candidatus Methanomethylicus sp.]